jgi:signal transduction histidine kinase
VAHHGEPLRVDDVRLDSRYILSTPAEAVTRSELAVPIKLRDQVIGVLNVESEEIAAFTQADVSTLQTIADQLAVAIHNARLYEQITSHAEELEQRVTERTAELKAANEHLKMLGHLKDEFVSNVSHELRTPITSLKLRIRLLETRPDKSEHLEVMRRETERLQRIVEGLLELSRLDQRKTTLDIKAVDLNTLVGIYVTDRFPIAKERDLKLSFTPEADLPSIEADPSLLGQVLGVLLTNALNYTPPGGQISVQTHTTQSGREKQVGFSVSDSGPGIPPDEIPRLFERFFRGSIGEQSRVPGTGLGLAIAQEIIEQHHGQIEVESEGIPGKGSTFKVWLPVHSEVGKSG